MPTPKKTSGSKSEPQRSLPVLSQDTVQHVYNHFDDNGPHISAKVEKNSRGYNWEAGVTGGRSVEEAMTLLTAMEAALREKFGEPVKVEKDKPQSEAAEDKIPF